MRKVHWWYFLVCKWGLDCHKMNGGCAGFSVWTSEKTFGVLIISLLSVAYLTHTRRTLFQYIHTMSYVILPKIVTICQILWRIKLIIKSSNKESEYIHKCIRSHIVCMYVICSYHSWNLYFTFSINYHATKEGGVTRAIKFFSYSITRNKILKII